MRRELIKTRDGSHTLFVPELNGYYHSLHGALSESLHVFIKNGLDFAKRKFDQIHLLEVGLGTGLNASLSFLHAGDFEIHYTALEPFPPEEGLIKELNYYDRIDSSILTAIHSLPFGERKTFSTSFHFQKLKTRIEDFETIEKFHLVYYDTFAPQAQPELWTKDVFGKIFQLTHAGGALVTYCAKGDVKRALKACGFSVEALPGPPGKREMIRAVKE